MSNEPNLLTPIVDATFDVVSLLCKTIFNAMGKKHYDFNALFRNIDFKNKDGKYVTFAGKEEAKYFEIFKFSIPIGMSVKNFEEKADVFAQFLGVSKDRLRFEGSGSRVNVKVITEKLQSRNYDIDKTRRDFKIVLGMDLNTLKDVIWDFTKSKYAHCYIASSSGGGKSYILRLILAQMINGYPACDIQLLLQNTKYVDLGIFKEARNTVVYNEGTNGIIEMLEDEVKLMKKRYALLAKHNCDDIGEYRQKVTKMPYRIIVIEELSSYATNDEGKPNKQFYKLLEDIAARGRASGQLLILTTQLPSAEILPNRIKNNINTTIGLKCKDAIRSEIVAGPGSELEKLQGNGHAKLFPDFNELQSDLVTKEQVLEIVNRYKKK